MSEAQEQRMVVEYCDLVKLPIFAIPNGGSRNKIEAANLKRQGVKAGVPDLFLPVARGGAHGLFIEMKFGKGKPSDKQKVWLQKLMAEGYQVAVCWSAAAAIKTIKQYMDGELAGAPGAKEEK